MTVFALCTVVVWLTCRQNCLPWRARAASPVIGLAHSEAGVAPSLEVIHVMCSVPAPAALISTPSAPQAPSPVICLSASHHSITLPYISIHLHTNSQLHPSVAPSFSLLALAARDHNYHSYYYHHHYHHYHHHEVRLRYAGAGGAGRSLAYAPCWHNSQRCCSYSVINTVQGDCRQLHDRLQEACQARAHKGPPQLGPEHPHKVSE